MVDADNAVVVGQTFRRQAAKDQRAAVLPEGFKRTGVPGQQSQVGRCGGDKGDFPIGVLDGSEGIPGLGILQPNRIHGFTQLLVPDDGGDLSVLQFVRRSAAD